MLTHDSEELINKVAALLGKFVPGEALGAVEHDTIDACIDNVLEEISKIVVVDREQIPNRYFESVARLLAIYAAASFSNTTPDNNTIRDQEQRLRYLVADTPTYETLKTSYF